MSKFHSSFVTIYCDWQDFESTVFSLYSYIVCILLGVLLFNLTALCAPSHFVSLYFIFSAVEFQTFESTLSSLSLSLSLSSFLPGCHPLQFSLSLQFYHIATVSFDFVLLQRFFSAMYYCAQKIKVQLLPEMQKQSVSLKKYKIHDGKST